MKTREFRNLMEEHACAPAVDSFRASHLSPKKWAERVFRKARRQLLDVIKRGHPTVWYDRSYSDGEFRRELGWFSWVVRPYATERLSAAELMHMIDKTKDPYKLLLKFLRSGRGW